MRYSEWSAGVGQGVGSVLCALVAFAPLAAGGPAAASDFELTSVTSAGVQANDKSYGSVISGDGQHVALCTAASSLLGRSVDPTCEQVYVRDRRFGTTVLVSVGPNGSPADAKGSIALSLSHDGRFVTFASKASNLVVDDTNAAWDVFVHDRDADGNGVFDEGNGVTERVSVNSKGEQGDGRSGWDDVPGARISADGRFVCFASLATNLVPDDWNNAADVFVHDRAEHTTERVSVSSLGVQGNADSGSWVTSQGLVFPWLSTVLDMSPDGRFVAFHSLATNIGAMSPCTAGNLRVYVRDRLLATTDVLIHIEHCDPLSYYCPRISADGRIVAFLATQKTFFPWMSYQFREVFVFDRTTEVIQMSSFSPGKDLCTGSTGIGAMSADGRDITYFKRWWTGPCELQTEAFRFNRFTEERVQISPSLPGCGGHYFDNGVWPSMSTQGRWVAFESQCDKIVPDDLNEAIDVFVRDFGPALPGDISGDEAVDAGDLEILLPAYGACLGQPAYTLSADLDADGCVTQADLAIVLENWFSSGDALSDGNALGR